MSIIVSMNVTFVRNIIAFIFVVINQRINNIQCTIKTAKNEIK